MVNRSEGLAALAKAKAAAQAKFIPLGKDKSATVALKSGGSYSYAYADLAACLESVMPALSEHGIALFQPVRIEDGCAIATTMLVHGESGEWIASDYAAVAVDPRDARSVGSASTYARRYGLLAMLAIASSDEDDDGEEARGGAHEMPAAKVSPVCPVCGLDAIIKGKAEYGGGWLCFKKRGGCGAKWPEGPFPTAAPVKVDEFKEQKAGNVEALFKDVDTEEREATLARIRGGFDKLALTEEARREAWEKRCGTTRYLTTDPPLDALTALLEDLRSQARKK